MAQNNEQLKTIASLTSIGSMDRPTCQDHLRTALANDLLALTEQNVVDMDLLDCREMVEEAKVAASRALAA